MSKNFGEFMAAAILCHTPEEAAKFVEQEVAEMCATFGKQPDEARTIVLQNIGYGSGYYDTKTHNRILELFNTTHPIFGRSNPTPEEAFAAGIALGEEAKRKTKSLSPEVRLR